MRVDERIRALGERDVVDRVFVFTEVLQEGMSIHSQNEAKEVE